MKTPGRWKNILPALLPLLLVVIFATGCNIDALLEEESQTVPDAEDFSQKEQSDYYNKFYEDVIDMQKIKAGTNPYIALDSLPKSIDGEINWTAAVLQGLINPVGSLDPDEPEEEPLKMTLFIEAKVPLMNNVVFPHSIHTYWLSCAACHPKIFIPKSGANPIKMTEIFAGEWCGRCHGKVAFNFYPIVNCRRCHAVLKGKSLQQEHFR